MDPDTRPHTPAKIQNRVWIALVVLAGLFHAIYVVHSIAPYAGGSDSSGYLNSAKLIMKGELVTSMRLPPGVDPDGYGPMVFMPLGLIETNKPAALIPSYPPGLPLHIAMLGKIIGIAPAICVLNLIFILGGGALTWGLARMAGLPFLWACVGAIVLWLNPLTAFVAVQPMSDLPSFFWCTLALYTALRSDRATRWAAVAGFSVGIAVLLRPANVLLAAPMAVALGFNWRKNFALIAGGLPAALFQLWYNSKTIGDLLATGYGDVSSAFAWENFLPSLQNVAWWLPGILSPLVLAGLFLAPAARGIRTKTGATLAAWLVTLIVFYLFYYHTREHWWYLRFIFPCFAAVIVIALAGLHEGLVVRAWMPARWSPTIAIVLLIGVITWTLRMERNLGVNTIKEGEARYKEMAEVVTKTIPPDAVIFCMQVSGSLFYYTDAKIIRWDNLHADNSVRLIDHLKNDSITIYAVLYEFETKEAFERLGGHWTEIRHAGNATIWRRDS